MFHIYVNGQFVISMKAKGRLLAIKKAERWIKAQNRPIRNLVITAKRAHAPMLTSPPAPTSAGKLEIHKR